MCEDFFTQTLVFFSFSLLLLSRFSYFLIVIHFFYREEKRTANIIADDENGVACLVIDRESFLHLIANLEDIKTRHV